MRRALVVLACLALAACGGSAGGKAASSGGAVLTPQQVADKAGCTGYASSSTELYVKEGGDCTLNGETITVDTFSDNTARDNFLKVAKGFGGVYGQGDRWIIEGDSADAVRAATQAAGGTEVP